MFRPFPCYNKQIERQEAAEEELQDRKRRQRAGNRRNGQNCEINSKKDGEIPENNERARRKENGRTKEGQQENRRMNPEKKKINPDNASRGTASADSCGTASAVCPVCTKALQTGMPTGFILFL